MTPPPDANRPEEARPAIAPVRIVVVGTGTGIGIGSVAFIRSVVRRSVAPAARSVSAMSFRFSTTT